ncbi:MAG: hypothetical protein DDT26_00213 [Dehalococcoidia bacterium]|nr:hypothetical protein [Chloroflexota bacterium]
MPSLTPFRDNYSLTFQLWAAPERTPGNELELSAYLEPELRVQFRNLSTDTVVLVAEAGSDYVTVVDALRGVVQVTLTGNAWLSFNRDREYELEVIAFNVLYHRQRLNFTLPSEGKELLNGVGLYAGPREILELLGPIPGAVVETSVPLDSGWSRDERGYWIKDIPAALQVFGLWIEDVHATGPIPYEQLALKWRHWARLPVTETTHRLYYNGPEDLATTTDNIFVESAFNRYVLRSLQEATKEFERRTGRYFNKQRYFAETHRGLVRQRQIMPRQYPVSLDEFFRLDAYGFSRNDLFRRYTEKDFVIHGSNRSESPHLHLEPSTGIITLTQNVWDWWDWANEAQFPASVATFAFFPSGEQNLDLTYTAGYDRPPTDVGEAVANMAAIRLGTFWQQALAQGLSGISIGCVSLSFGDLLSRWFPSWQQSAERIIEIYTRHDLEAF